MKMMKWERCVIMRSVIRPNVERAWPLLLPRRAASILCGTILVLLQQQLRLLLLLLPLLLLLQIVVQLPIFVTITPQRRGSATPSPPT